MKRKERPRCLGCEFSQQATWPFVFCLLKQRHVTRNHRCRYGVNRRKSETL